MTGFAVDGSFDSCRIHSHGMTVLILTFLLYYIFSVCASCQRPKRPPQRLACLRGSALRGPRRGGVPRLRVQRYDNFLNPPNLFTTFFEKFFRGLAHTLYIIYRAREGTRVGWRCRIPAPGGAMAVTDGWRRWAYGALRMRPKMFR